MSDAKLTLSKVFILDGHSALLGGTFDPAGRLVDFRLEPLAPEWVTGAALVRRRMAEGEALCMVAAASLRGGQGVAHRLATQLAVLEEQGAVMARVAYELLDRAREGGGHAVL